MSQTVKSGWLMRQTTILKRWKKEWFSLSMDGYLRYFEDQDNAIACDTLFMPEHVKEVRMGVFVHVPEGHSIKHTIHIVCHDKNDWTMCADSLDDALAWQYALEQARVLRQPHRQLQSAPPQYILDAMANNPNNGFPTFYTGSYTGNYPSRVIHTPQGPVTIVYLDSNVYRPYNDWAFGAITGAALATTLMWPFWWPIWWL